MIETIEFCSQDGSLRLRVGAEQAQYVLELCKTALPYETGGLLIGYYSQSHQVAEVVQATGAPPDSRSGRTWFNRGVKGFQPMLDHLWEENQHYYIGEWHFHPLGLPIPSSTDINQLTKIANSKKYNCPEPILLIIGGNPPLDWSARAFMFKRGRSSYIELFRSGLDEYEHVGLIDEGFFSIVKHYTHKRTGRACAIKELKRERFSNSTHVRWFEREIRLLVELKGHENILELLYYQCDHGRRYFYITPKADTNLYNFIKRYNSSLESGKRIGIFDQVLSAIKHAHSKGVLHRDIAPTNVLLFKHGENYSVKVSDFGLAKNVTSTSSYTRSEVSNYGHIYYVAPEQRDKLKSATERSDIYSLGKLLNFVVTGKDPEIIHVCDFMTVIEKATQYDAEARYENITEFESAYEEIKSLLQLEEVPGEIWTLSAFLGSTANVNWHKFHRLAVGGQYKTHIYSDYVSPIVEVLSDSNNLRGYYNAVGTSIEEFVTVFTKRLEDLAGTLGWPFTATTSFGELLRDIFVLVPDPRIKLRCLVAIWDLAFERDQWTVQSIVKRILDGSSIPNEIQASFAVHILRSKASVSLDSFSHLNVPKVIWQALIKKAR